jgi:energy-coupling factor transporter ATP-binding protein EcfA2
MDYQYKLGRAEFDTEIMDNFEDISIKYLMAPLFLNNETKLIIGERGVGKTHLLRLLAKEIPSEIYILDKEQIFEGVVSYSPIQSVKHPQIVIVDDLHYLLKTMQIIKLDSGGVSEDAIIINLNDFKQYADSKKATLVFVADEGVSGLSLRFDEGNRKRFLELFGNCVDSPDDAGFLMKYFPNRKFSTTRNNVLNLNDRGTLSFYRNTINYINSLEQREVEMGDFENELLNASRQFERRLLNASEKVVNQFKMRDIPFGVYGSLNEDIDEITFFHYFINDAGNISPYPYLVERKGIPIMTKEIDNKFETYKYTKRTQFASFRQLKILYDTFGEISMKKLEINIKKPLKEEISESFPFETGIKFNIDDLRKIVWKMHNVLRKIIGDYSYKELAAILSNPDHDPLIEYILYDLEFE